MIEYNEELASDPEHIHIWEPIDDWADPSGEAELKREQRRRSVCSECGDIAEESRPFDFDEEVT